MTQIQPIALLWTLLRLSLGSLLLVATGLVSAYFIRLSLAPIAIWGRCLLGLFALFFAAQAYAVCRILLFRSSLDLRIPRPFLSRGGGADPAVGTWVPAPPRGRPPTLSASAKIPHEDRP